MTDVTPAHYCLLGQTNGMSVVAVMPSSLRTINSRHRHNWLRQWDDIEITQPDALAEARSWVVFVLEIAIHNP